MKTLKVSRASAGFLQRGHPWVRPDRFTEGLAGLTAGEPVQLVDERGRGIAAALADPGDEICARVYSRDPRAAFAPEAAFAAAWKRRGRFHRDGGTDCYRLVHGEADGLPGLRVERYGEVVVVLVLADCARPAVDPVCAAIARELPTARIVVREHRDDLRRAAVATRMADGSPVDADAVVVAKELGCRYPLRPFAGLATGLYVDQRATRRWLRTGIAGKRVLNLFAYTGAFSICLLAAGAASALDVDLAAPALARGQEAAELNGVADRYRSIHGDCLAVLAEDRASYDLVICDPPTAAQGGEGGWIGRRDYPRLLALILPRLAPGGLLVACSNTLGGKPVPLDEWVVAAAAETGTGLIDIDGPPLDPDLPQLNGFPEGRPFRLVAARRG